MLLNACLFHQRGQRDIKTLADTVQVHHRQIMFTALDTTHVRAVNACVMGKSFLR